MDEKYMEMAGDLAQAETDHGRANCSKEAIPSEDLEPEQYKVLECSECEDPLPLFRVKKGLTICVPCKELQERKKKM